jgi:hypothetical protein
MITLDKDMKFRCFVLDALVAHSGKKLLPELIGDITSEIVSRARDIYASLPDAKDDKRV